MNGIWSPGEKIELKVYVNQHDIGTSVSDIETPLRA
jgi:hypothetical protein